MLNVVCEKTRIIWVFITESKQPPVRILRFTLTTSKNDQHPCKCVKIDKDSELENSTNLTNLLVDEFNISMETTGVDESWLNGKNERNIRIIHKMVISGLTDINQHENK